MGFVWLCYTKSVSFLLIQTLCEYKEVSAEILISENIKYIVGYNNGLTASLTYYLYCYDSKGDIVAIDKLAL